MIELIDKVVDQAILEKAVQRYKEKGIILPTFAQQKNPELVPEKVTAKLKDIGLWDLNPLNLYRINWKNEPREIFKVVRSRCSDGKRSCFNA